MVVNLRSSKMVHLSRVAADPSELAPGLIRSNTCILLPGAIRRE
jgi:hypothetical protein